MTGYISDSGWIEGDVIGVPALTPKNTAIAVYWNDHNKVGIPDDSIGVRPLNLATPNPGAWHKICVYDSCPNLAGLNLKAVLLYSELLITHGTAPETSDIEIYLRKHGVADEPPAYSIHAVAGLMSEGNRSHSSIWVPLDEDGCLDFKWGSTGGIGNPSHSEFGFAVNINAYLRVGTPLDVPQSTIPPVSEWTVVRAPAMTGDGGGFAGYTVVAVAKGPFPVGAHKVSVLLSPCAAMYGNTVIQNCYIGRVPSGGKPWDFDAAGVLLATARTLVQGGTDVVVQADLVMLPGDNLAIAFDIGALGAVRYGSDPNMHIYAKPTTSPEAAMQTKSEGYIDFGALSYIVGGISFHP